MDNTKNVQYTVKREEVIKSLSITLKQLRTWQEQGLFHPELGERARGFTSRDVERLRFVKRLLDRDEIGLPINVVQRLLAAHQPFPAKPSATIDFLVLQGAPELINRSQALERTFNSMGLEAIQWSWPDDGEHWMDKWVALRFWLVGEKNPSRHQREYEKLMELFKTLALGSRVKEGWDQNGDLIWGLEPRRPNDPELSQEELGGLFDESCSLLGEFGRGASEWY